MDHQSIILTNDMAKKSYFEIKEIWKLFENNKIMFETKYKLFGSCITVRQAKAGKMLFIELMDGSTIRTLQCVIDSSPSEENDLRHKIDWEPLFKHCSRGATVELIGTIEKSPAKGQPIEFVVYNYTYLGKIKDSEKYFMGKRGFIHRDILRQIPHQRHHTQLFLALQIIKQLGYKSLHEAFNKLNINEVQPTFITGNECEEGAHPFTITTLLDSKNIPKKENGTINWSKDFFGKQCYMTVSSQLHLEATIIGTKRDGYCMTTAFRAEPSRGPLHLAEFLMPEWELIGGGLNRNMAVAQYVLKYIFIQILDKCENELRYLEEYRKKDDKIWYNTKVANIKKLLKTKEITKKKFAEMKKEIDKIYQKRQSIPSITDRLTKYINIPFIVTTHMECVNKMLDDIKTEKVNFDEIPKHNGDFTKQHESYITDIIFEGMPTFVRYYPKKIKPFYMPVIEGNSDVEHVDCYDLLFPYIGEIVGGSQRIDNEEELCKRMKEMNINYEPLEWYIDLRRNGSLPHGGAGLGFGRLMTVISGINNIKDMQEFPRAYGMKCCG